MKRQIWLGILLLMSACGSPPPAHVRVNLRMPATLARQTPRYRRFVAQASHLEVRVNGEKRAVFPVTQWETPMDVVMVEGRVEVALFDRRRSEPVLTGEAKVSPGEEAVTLKLKLLVEPQAYD